MPKRRRSDSMDSDSDYSEAGELDLSFYEMEAGVYRCRERLGEIVDKHLSTLTNRFSDLLNVCNSSTAEINDDDLTDLLPALIRDPNIQQEQLLVDMFAAYLGYFNSCTLTAKSFMIQCEYLFDALVVAAVISKDINLANACAKIFKPCDADDLFRSRLKKYVERTSSAALADQLEGVKLSSPKRPPSKRQKY